MPVQGSYWILPLSCAYHWFAFPYRCPTFIDFFCSCERAKQYHQPSFWIILLRSHRHWYNTGRRTFRVHLPDLRPNTRLGSRNGQFSELLHIPYILFLLSIQRISPFPIQLAIPPSMFLSPLEDRRVGLLALLTSNSLG